MVALCKFSSSVINRSEGRSSRGISCVGAMEREGLTRFRCFSVVLSSSAPRSKKNDQRNTHIQKKRHPVMHPTSRSLKRIPRCHPHTSKSFNPKISERERMSGIYIYIYIYVFSPDFDALRGWVWYALGLPDCRLPDSRGIGERASPRVGTIN